MPRVTLAIFSSVLLATLGAPPAYADEAPERRAVPDYDGRPDPGPDAIDALLWVPRVITSPLYLVSEFLVRRPLGALIEALERSDALRLMLGLFTFGGRQDLVLLPMAFFDFGFAPSVGIFAAWNQFVFDENRMSLRAATGESDWLTFAVADTVTLPDNMQLRLSFSGLKRPDQQIGGIGFDATQFPIARYGIERIEAGLQFGLRPGPGIELDYVIRYRGVGYLDEGWQGEPSVGDLRRDLPAFDTGYSAISLGARAAFDSRSGCASREQSSAWDSVAGMVAPSRELPSEECELSTAGVRVVIEAYEHFSFGGLPGSEWLRWGGEMTGATDFLGRGRVFSLSARVQLVSALGARSVVPFTELIQLSGLMRGFQPGVALGASAAALTLAYTWPIWAFLDGTMHLALGNAFGESFEDFDIERLRMSFGIYLAPRFQGQHFLELGIAFGSETFARDAAISSVRFVVGARSAL